MTDPGGSVTGIASLRLLSSTSAGLEQKLHAALQLALPLLPSVSAERLRAACTNAHSIEVAEAPVLQEHLPRAVQAHYIQAVFDWATSTLTRSANDFKAASDSAKRPAADNAATASKKRKGHDSQQKETSNATCEAYADSRLWLLAAVLTSAGARLSSSAILSAAAAACGHAAATATPPNRALLGAIYQLLFLTVTGTVQGVVTAPGVQGVVAEGVQGVVTAPGVQGVVAEGVQGILAVTGALRHDFHPTIESWGMLLSALTSHNSADSDSAELSSDSCSELILLVLEQLAHAVQGSSNPRKALASVLTPALLHPLLHLAFPTAITDVVLQHQRGAHTAWGLSQQDHQSTRRAATPGHLRELRQAAQRVLETALLHEAHLPGLAEACHHLATPVLASSKTPQVPDNAANADKVNSSSAMISPSLKVDISSIRSYHGTILQALADAARADHPQLRSAGLSSLAWLLEASGPHWTRLRRLHVTESASGARLGQSSAGRGRKRGADVEEGGDGAGQSEGVLQHAEFDLLVAAACAMLGNAGDSGNDRGASGSQPASKRRKKEPHVPVATPASAATVEEVVFGLTALLLSAKACRAYEPSRDTQQLHRGFLTTVATTLLSLKTHPQQPPQLPATAAAVSCALCAVLQLEHRAVRASVPDLWALLQETAQETLPVTTNPRSSPAASCGTVSTDAMALAGACASELITAYSEIRQLNLLLNALADALVTSTQTDSSQQTEHLHKDSTQHIAHRRQRSASLCQLVLQPTVRQALTTAMAKLPSGQGAPLLTDLANRLRPLLQPPAVSDTTSDAVYLAAGALMETCVQGVRLDLPTAAPLAATCVHVISLLGEPLVTVLTHACRKSKKAGPTLAPAHLAMLLNVYRAVTSLHARCVALNPEVAPLPSQAVFPAGSPGPVHTAAPEGQQGSGTHPACDSAVVPSCSNLEYFAPALDSAGAAVAQALLSACAKKSSQLLHHQSQQQQGPQGEDNYTAADNQGTMADILLVLASRQLLPCLTDLASSKGLGDSSTGTELALASAVLSCLLEHAATLQDHVRYLGAACGTRDQLASWAKQRAAAEVQLVAVMQQLLPECLLQPLSSLEEADSQEKGVGSTLPAWLQLPAPEPDSSLPLLLIQHSQSAQNGGPALQGVSPGLCLSHARGVLLSKVWSGLLQTLSCRGQETCLDPAAVQNALQIQLACHAVIGPRADGMSSTLQHWVARSASRVLQHTPEWQTLPHVAAQLSPAYCHVATWLARRLCQHMKDLRLRSTAPGKDTEARCLEKLQAGLRLSAQGQLAEAGKKLTKVMKAFSNEVPACAQSDSMDMDPAVSQTLAAAAQHVGSHAQFALNYHILSASALQQLWLHGLLGAAMVLQLLADCLLEFKGPTGSQLVQALLSTLHASLLNVGSVQSVLSRVLPQTAGNHSSSSSSMATHPLPDTWPSLKQHLAWMHAASQLITICTGSGATTATACGQQQPGATACVDLTSVHAALAWVQQGAVALQLQRGRVEAAGKMVGDGDQEVLAGSSAVTGQDSLRKVVKAAQRALDAATHIVDGGVGGLVVEVQRSAALLCAVNAHISAAGQEAFNPAAASRRRRRAQQAAAAASAHSLLPQLAPLAAKLQGLLVGSDDAARAGTVPVEPGTEGLLVAYAAVLQLVGTAAAHPAGPSEDYPATNAVVVASDLHATLDSSVSLVTAQGHCSPTVSQQRLQTAAAVLLNAATGLLPHLTSSTHNTDHSTLSTGPAFGQLHAALMQAHTALLTACCPPGILGTPPYHTLLGSSAVEDFDVPAGSHTAMMRSRLLASLKRLVVLSSTSQFRSLLQHTLRNLQSVTAGMAEHGVVPDNLFALMLCLLALLETEANPSKSKVLEAATLDITTTLHSVLATLTARQSVHGMPALPHAQHASRISAAAAGVAGFKADSVAWASSHIATTGYLCLRALSSLTGRPLTFPMSDMQISTILGAVAALLPATVTPVTASCAAHHAMLIAACALLCSCIRHRAPAVRGGVPVLVGCVRGLLTHLVAWSHHHSAQQGHAQELRAAVQAEGLVQGGHASGASPAAEARLTDGAMAIARVYEALAEDKEGVQGLRTYCMHLVADYITLVGVGGVSSQGLLLGPGAVTAQPSHSQPIPPRAAHALRQGVLLLLGSLGARELQALHATLGAGWDGTRRAVLASLKQEWEKNIKYTGKV